MRTIFAAALASCMAMSASAQSVQTCDWQARADAIVEPWEDNSRTFANGDVRIALLDTIEPAAGAFWLLVLAPPYDELGGRSCYVIGDRGVGFSGVLFDGLEANYDPAQGLVFTAPVFVYDQAYADSVPFTLRFVVNQARGAVTAQLE